mmetsp:Transcript_15299/g.13011  ORF Transcript_15299/g.13011 Transcript_15299/m.13011 type:complete len:250 (-) Transcript_15299:55-804(-)
MIEGNKELGILDREVVNPLLVYSFTSSFKQGTSLVGGNIQSGCSFSNLEEENTKIKIIELGLSPCCEFNFGTILRDFTDPSSDSDIFFRSKLKSSDERNGSNITSKVSLDMLSTVSFTSTISPLVHLSFIQLFTTEVSNVKGFIISIGYKINRNMIASGTSRAGDLHFEAVRSDFDDFDKDTSISEVKIDTIEADLNFGDFFKRSFKFGNKNVGSLIVWFCHKGLIWVTFCELTSLYSSISASNKGQGE